MSSTRPQAGPPRLKLTLTATAESIIRGGHPWVYSDSVRSQNREGRMGELAVMYDRKDKFLAVGLYDPDSPLRVRVLHAGKPTTLNDAWWQAHLEAALARRSGIADAETNGLRLINGESDGWPGLVLDQYDNTFVLKLYTAAWLSRLAELQQLIIGTLKPERLVLRLSRNIQAAAAALINNVIEGSNNARHPLARPSAVASDALAGRSATLSMNQPTPDPSQEGNQKRGASCPAPLMGGFRGSSESEGIRGTSAISDSNHPPLTPLRRGTGLCDGQILHGPPLEGVVTFLESGIRFESDVLRGQKTGFFLDQRENRRHVETFAGGADVLNAFSFSGGFSLYAARGGAKSVTDLDLSSHALAAAERNFKLNLDCPTVSACDRRAIQADAFEWIERARPAQFDVVIVDPPSLAKRETERAGAIQAYGRLNANAIRLLRPRGVLVAASCSAHVSAEEFFSAVRSAAGRSGQRFEALGTTGHAPDHHATFPEAQYLKCLYLRFA